MLKRALDSVYGQSLAPDAIHLVVDEPEDRDKYGFLAGYDNTLRVTFTGGDCGGAGARNLGLDQVEADFVFFLDDDDEWLPKKVEKQIQLLNDRPDSVGVSCDIYRCHHGKRTLEKRNETQMNRCVRLWNGIGGFSCFGMRWYGELASLRLRDELASAQDYEFYMRVARLGRIANLNEPQVLFVNHDGNRITGDRLQQRESYMKILRLDREMFTFREYSFNVAFAELWSACARQAFTSVFYSYFKGTWYLFIAFKEPQLSLFIWSSSSMAILRRFRRRLHNWSNLGYRQQA